MQLNGAAEAFSSQNRQQLSAILNSNVIGLKTFLIDFFTEIKLGARIKAVENSDTRIEFQGPSAEVMRTKEKLEISLSENFLVLLQNGSPP
jgi:hypothetical protein